MNIQKEKVQVPPEDNQSNVSTGLEVKNKVRKYDQLCVNRKDGFKKLLIK
jgi:hypothetical protein